MDLMLTPKEISEILKVSIDDVVNLLDSGELRGMKVAEKWRILVSDFESFMVSTISKQQNHILLKELQNPERWAEIISEDSSLRIKLSESDFPENSMGQYLKDSLKIREDKRSSKSNPTNN
jgi:excisionase family DNA binding protein